MKWYFRYPLALALLVGYSIFDRATRLLPVSDSILPQTGGDFVGLIALGLAMAAGAVLWT